MLKNHKNLILTLLVTLVVVLAVFRYWESAENLLGTLWRASLPFIGGAMIAYVVNILMSGYERIYYRLFKGDLARKFSRSITLLLAYATFAILVIVLLGIVIPELVESIQSLIANAPKAIENLIREVEENEWLSAQINQFYGSDAAKELNDRINAYATEVFNGAGTFLLGLLTSVTDIFSAIVNILMSLIFSVYVLVSKEDLANQLRRLIQTYLPTWYGPFDAVRKVFHESFRSFFTGQMTEAVILGTLVFLGMTLFKFPYASTIGILVGFTNIFPIIGAYIGGIVGMILVMTQSFSQALWFLVFIVVLQQIESNLIYPRVVGNSVGLPGMWVIVSVTVGGAFGGIFGMLISVPFFASIYKLVRQDVLRREEERLLNQEETI
ncbi:AI-2E family transporter [Streptococcus moroccensis]|uniref:PurR-regulated permease PerM n=1 Tax=Streptococcus moroccensis TaxID=1451356 RepID=A0ABT9YSB6_9STRE|nr:AI-2E family transporter [Streptococcus moroccensis]MDQ0222883.1 putative PurR-regulated permease PerM [Streptococcus moroccensis]